MFNLNQAYYQESKQQKDLLDFYKATDKKVNNRK